MLSVIDNFRLIGPFSAAAAESLSGSDVPGRAFDIRKPEARAKSYIAE
jgi:hypothetical protein